MVGGEGNRDAVPAKYGTGIPAVGDDDLLRRDNGNDGGSSDGVALRSPEFATAIGDPVAAV